MSPFPLHTPRLLLRPMRPDDALAFSRYRSHPDVARYQSWEAPYSLEQAQHFMAGMQNARPGHPGEWFQVGIENRKSGALIGDCAFGVLEEDPRQAEIGFTLAHEAQGQGFAAEAVARLLAYLFGELQLHRVRANCDPQNESSARLLLRLGFRHEGRFLQSLWFKGGWADEDWFALLESEWQDRQA
jgi:RimJ/RimL family protein N-acetyltransferase